MTGVRGLGQLEHAGAPVRSESKVSMRPLLVFDPKATGDLPHGGGASHRVATGTGPIEVRRSSPEGWSGRSPDRRRQTSMHTALGSCRGG